MTKCHCKLIFTNKRQREREGGGEKGLQNCDCLVGRLRHLVFEVTCGLAQITPKLWILSCLSKDVWMALWGPLYAVCPHQKSKVFIDVLGWHVQRHREKQGFIERRCNSFWKWSIPSSAIVHVTKASTFDSFHAFPQLCCSLVWIRV